MKGTVILFARVPRYGTVKSRLARDIGRLNALRFYRQTLASTIRKLNHDPRWRLVIAATPDRQRLGRLPGIAKNGMVVPQGNGDLGQRMARALSSPRTGPTLIVGTDIPDVTALDISVAFRTLGRADAVFGTAVDGGYWLVGLSGRKPAPRGLFSKVRWSGPHALSDSLSTCPRRWRTAFMDARADIDDGKDYAAWKAQNRRT